MGWVGKVKCRPWFRTGVLSRPWSQEPCEGRLLSPSDGYTPAEWQMVNTLSCTQALVQELLSQRRFVGNHLFAEVGEFLLRFLFWGMLWRGWALKTGSLPSLYLWTRGMGSIANVTLMIRWVVYFCLRLWRRYKTLNRPLSMFMWNKSKSESGDIQWECLHVFCIYL